MNFVSRYQFCHWYYWPKIHLGSVAVKCDAIKYDGAGCWSCQEVLCTTRCVGGRFGILVVGCGNFVDYIPESFRNAANLSMG